MLDYDLRVFLEQNPYNSVVDLEDEEYRDLKVEYFNSVTKIKLTFSKWIQDSGDARYSRKVD